MEYIQFILDLIRNLDEMLPDLIAKYHNWIYAILFAIIFIETGLIIMPFLPGDSLLFVAGSLAAIGSLNLVYVLVLLFIAAFLGDTVNYWIGRYIGHRATELKLFGRRLVKQQHLDKTHAFYEKHGPKTIIIARFMPIVRTFAPFVAGVGTMSYRQFITYNLIGGFIWVVGITMAGYFFGQTEWVKNNFEFVVYGIIVISLVPLVIEFIRQLIKKDKNKKQP